MRSVVFLLMMFVSLASKAGANIYDCNYLTYSDESGNHENKGTMQIRFIVPDLPNKPYIDGMGDDYALTAVVAEEHLTFVVIDPYKSVWITTITKSLDSVHSRNTVQLGKLIPSQYYGKCIKNKPVKPSLG